MNTSSKIRASIIKKALVKTYGRKNVSVIKGRGTASSWVEARVKVSNPLCGCNENVIGRCETCKNVFIEHRHEIEKIANEALRANGAEHSTFYADDGYNTEMNEFLAEVKIN